MTQPRAALPYAVSVALVAGMVQGCTDAVKPDPHYVLGRPYQAAGVWVYPHEAYDLDETGLATIVAGGHPNLTTDGEAFDQTALAAAHPTVQLPAIARLTNLENGRQVVVRLNDRGSADPHRLVEITRRTATVLGMPLHGVARVRLQLLPGESRAAVEAVPGAPRLAISAAPREAVEVAELPPPAGLRAAGGRPPPVPMAHSAAQITPVTPPARLPETVTQTVPHPGRLMVRLDTFSEFQYAAVQQAKMRSAGAHTVPVLDGHTFRFRVEVGPFQDVPHADAVLDQALAHGIPDARILID